MNNLARNLLIVSAVFIALLGSVSFYFAKQDYEADSVIFNTSKDIAINGYDTVAYFNQKSSLRGEENYQAEWAGSVWYFANSENRNTFVENPQNYAPQYGGYDPVGISKGYTNPTDPELYTLLAGRLYLHYSKPYKDYWNEDRAATMVLANSNWVFLREKLLNMQTAQ